MWAIHADRKEFLDLITKGHLMAAGTQFKPRLDKDLRRTRQSLRLIWRQEPSARETIPNVVLLPRKEIRDFLAWVTTYVPWLRPFTAYCRVLDDSQAQELDELEVVKPSLGKYESLCVGAIIGECMEHLANGEIRRTTPTSAMSTYSFARARTLALHVSDQGNQSLSSRLSRTREVTKQRRRALDVTAVAKIWDIISSIALRRSPGGYSLWESGLRDKIGRACSEILEEGRIGRSTWDELAFMLPRGREVISQMSATREERVVSFEDFANSLLDLRGRDSLASGFLCGYVASRIAPGSLAHIGLIERYAKEMPGTIVWYCACAGLYRENDVPLTFDGLGYRILREVLREESFFERPLGDISFEELEVLLDTEDPDLDFLTAGHNQLMVEVLPRVYSVVTWPPSSLSTQEVSPRDATPLAQPVAHQGETVARQEAMSLELEKGLTALRNLQGHLEQFHRDLLGANTQSSKRKRGLSASGRSKGHRPRGY